MAYIEYPKTPPIRVYLTERVETSSGEGYFTEGHKFTVDGYIRNTGQTCLIDAESNNSFRRSVYAYRHQFNIIEE